MVPDSARPLVFSEAELDRIGAGDIVVRDGVVDVRPWLALALLTPVLPAGIGRGGVARPDVRADRTAFVDWPEAIAWFDALGTALSTGMRVALPAMTVQLAIFAAGARYVGHRDALAGDAYRRLTATLYLDVSWTADDGGALRGAGRDTTPLGGRLVVFRSDLVLHEVLPPRRRRVALTAWFGSDGMIRR